MPPTAVSMVSLRDTSILCLPPAPRGMSAAVIAVPMTRMPALFDGAGPSQVGREDIVESEENNLHRNLGLIPIVSTPLLQIPQSS